MTITADLAECLSEAVREILPPFVQPTFDAVDQAMPGAKAVWVTVNDASGKRVGIGAIVWSGEIDAASLAARQKASAGSQKTAESEDTPASDQA